MRHRIDGLGVEVVVEDERPVVYVCGEIDLVTAEPLRAAISAAAAGIDRQIDVDLRDVTFMDSSGLAVLVTAHQYLDLEGRVLMLRDPSPRVQRLLRLTGLWRLFNVRDGEQPSPAS